MRLIVLYKDGQRMECLDDIEQAHFYEDKVVTNKLPLNIRVIDFKKEDIASINCQDLNEDVVVRQKQEIEKLKQQLIEKEKEIERWHNNYKQRDRQFQSVRQRYHLLNRLQAKYHDKHKLHLSEMQCLELVEENEKLHQDKISFCIERLEKVKKFNRSLVLGGNYKVDEFIDNQIKQLKEKQDERN